jgi:hypothetical protein
LGRSEGTSLRPAVAAVHLKEVKPLENTIETSNIMPMPKKPATSNHTHPRNVSIKGAYVKMIEEIKGRLEDSRFNPIEEQFQRAIEAAIFMAYQKTTRKKAVEIREEFGLPPSHREAQSRPGRARFEDSNGAKEKEWRRLIQEAQETVQQLKKLVPKQ